MQVRFLALLCGLRIHRCHEPWRRSQTQLRSDVAVAVSQASSYSSDLIPRLGTSVCCKCGPKKQKKKKRKKMYFQSFTKEGRSQRGIRREIWGTELLFKQPSPTALPPRQHPIPPCPEPHQPLSLQSGGKEPLRALDSAFSDVPKPMAMQPLDFQLAKFCWYYLLSCFLALVDLWGRGNIPENKQTKYWLWLQWGLGKEKIRHMCSICPLESVFFSSFKGS